MLKRPVIRADWSVESIQFCKKAVVMPRVSCVFDSHFGRFVPRPGAERKLRSKEEALRRLAENDLKPWRKDMWCIPQVDGEYVARMEDVLELYAEAPDPKRPVVCFDESPVQLIGEVRQPIPARPSRLERYDYEYRRNGTVNLFVFLDVNRPWRKVKLTERRAAKDYAKCNA
jgi:hypothetical protein